MSEYRTVAVGTDGSTSARMAVVKAAQLAADSGARLVIVCAYQVRSPEHDPDQADAADALGSEKYRVVGASPAEDTLASAREDVRQCGAQQVDTLALEGDPTEVILDASARVQADLVVVGNKGLASLAGRLLGSVPQAVSRRSDRDVLVVHTV